MKQVAKVLTGLAIFLGASAANAGLFSFNFSNVTGAVPGDVSGVITLPDGDGVFSASSVVVQSSPAALGWTLPEEFVSATYTFGINEFTVVGNQIVDVEFIAATFGSFDAVGLSIEADAFFVGTRLTPANKPPGSGLGGGVVDGSGFTSTLVFGSIPLPSTIVLFGLGLAGLGLSRRRKALN